MPSTLHLNIFKLERRLEKHPLKRSVNIMEGDNDCGWGGEPLFSFWVVQVIEGGVNTFQLVVGNAKDRLEIIAVLTTPDTVPNIAPSHRQAVVVSVDPRRVYVTSPDAPEAGVSCDEYISSTWGYGYHLSLLSLLS